VTERLDGTAALVTGASSGIGAATARALARHGASVSLVARRKPRLDELASDLARDGTRVLPIEADITDRDLAVAAVRETVDEFGRLDTVVNNAGVMLLGPVLDAPTEEWDRMIAINLQALLYITHAALPQLLKAAQDSPRRVADVVNISSVAGRTVRVGSAVYNATKWGIGAFSESLRQEVAQRYVRVSLVEPGAADTELRTHLRPEARAQQGARFANVVRLRAEDIAEAVGYVVTRNREVAINEVLIRPTTQVN
jgi:NADP-dependent 3-hydroxy acid dehydrogenase YdfG